MRDGGSRPLGFRAPAQHLHGVIGSGGNHQFRVANRAIEISARFAVSNADFLVARRTMEFDLSHNVLI
jgi:hypothetical protein